MEGVLLYRNPYNSNSVLLWDEMEQYVPDSPPCVFIITTLNFTTNINNKNPHKPNKTGVFYVFISWVLTECSWRFLFQQNITVKYNRLLNSVPESFSWISVFKYFDSLLYANSIEINIKKLNKLNLPHLWLDTNRILCHDIKATNYWFIYRAGRSSLSVFSYFIAYSSLNIPT